MEQRFIDIGDVKRAMVQDVFPRAGKPLRPGAVVLVDADHEGYCLMLTEHAIEPRKGMLVEMQFTAGGLWRGHWRIIKEITE